MTRPTLTVLIAALGLAATACSRSEPPQSASTTAAVPGPGDAERGRRVFGACRSCHAVEGGIGRVGPSLFAVVDRPAARTPTYAYSKAMQASGLVWTEAELDAYLENPRARVPGTKMSFAGVSDPQARRDVIAYLATLK